MRILLKLSGEALAGPKKTGFDEETVRKVALQVKQLVDSGTQVGIVIGGGNFWRGRTSENIDRTKADQIGMLATIMNCIYVSEIFRSEGMMTNILTPFECGSFTKLFSKDRANKYFAHNMVVFFADSAKLEGEVKSTGTVKVGLGSVIVGNIGATSAVIAGAVKGDIDVHGPVVLDTTAIVMGNIKSQSVQINNGAVIEGMCSQAYADVNPSEFFETLRNR